MMTERAPAVLHLVQIAIGQPVLLQKMAVLIFQGEVKSPEIAAILAGRVFFGAIDDAELKPVGARGRHSRQGEEPKANGFKHSLLSAASVIALLNTGAQIHLAPPH